MIFAERGGSFLSQVYGRCCNRQSVGASAVSCDCFFSVDLLVTFVRHFLIYSFLGSFVSRAMKVARVIAAFQQE